MSMLLALMLAAAVHEPVNANTDVFDQSGYKRAPIVAGDRKMEGLPGPAAAWNGSAWWQALVYCNSMHGIQGLRLEASGAAKPALDEQDALAAKYRDLAVARLVADRGITGKQAWDEIGEAEDAYWSFSFLDQTIDYRIESMTCRLFQSRATRL